MSIVTCPACKADLRGEPIPLESIAKGARVVPPNPPRREPTHWVSGGRYKRHNRTGGLIPPGIKACSAQQRRRTPVDFARFLLRIAASCTPPRVPTMAMRSSTDG